MKIASLLYHDVVPPGAWASSGFAGGDADIYKLAIDQFEQHLEAIGRKTRGAAIPVFHALEGRAGKQDFLLTFDDGGSSALEYADPVLRERSWLGHFFITTDYIGKPGFLSRAGIQELFRRGHVIGSHSCSHPRVISQCSCKELQREWGESVAVLSDILGSAVTTASIPGGFYSKRVEEAAAAAGIRVLFTSEPTNRVEPQSSCTLVGRYSIQQGTAAAQAAALAANDFRTVATQRAFWNVKKVLKAVGGQYWHKARKAWFNR